MKAHLPVLTLASIAAVLLGTSPAPAEPRTHDGFYLHLEGGIGYLSTSTDTTPEGTYSGLSLDSALLLGGTVGPVVIGGGFTYDTVPLPSYEVDGQEWSADNVTQYMIGIGPFVDIYPDPKSGLHFLGFVGWGGLETSVEGNVGGSDPTGLVAIVGGGYDFWLADEWSVGPLARLTYAPLSMNDVSFDTFGFGLVADFKYH